MSAISYIDGDATAPKVSGTKIIAHVCNDIGAWGKGFVVAVSRRWIEPETAYRTWHQNRETNDFSLGAVQLVGVEAGLFVANMIGQTGIRKVRGIPPIRYEAIDTCLEQLSQLAKQHNASVHMPRIGCGLAGGTWDKIEPLIARHLLASAVPVWVYDLPTVSPSSTSGPERISRTKH